MINDAQILTPDIQLQDITLQNVQVYEKSIGNYCKSVESVALVTTELISRCDEISEDMAPVYVLGRQL